MHAMESLERMHWARLGGFLAVAGAGVALLFALARSLGPEGEVGAARLLGVGSSVASAGTLAHASFSRPTGTVRLGGQLQPQALVSIYASTGLGHAPNERIFQVRADEAGRFELPGAGCGPGRRRLYLVATVPGSAPLVAPLGDCAKLREPVTIDEASTSAAVYDLAGFAHDDPGYWGLAGNVALACAHVHALRTLRPASLAPRSAAPWDPCAAPAVADVGSATVRR